MSAIHDGLKELPAEILERLQQLIETLSHDLGDNLVSLVAFGSAVRGGWQAGQSDVDLLIVMRNPDRAALTAIANTLAIARSARRFEAMILAAAEVSQAADVFPLLYDDIQSAHVLLAGKDVFADLVVSDAHRRLRIEQELRDMQIRLRRAVVDALGSPTQLVGPVERKLKQLRGPLHALLALRKTPAENDRLDAVLAQASSIYGIDTAPLANLQHDTLAALDALNELLGRAIEDVDRIEALP